MPHENQMNSAEARRRLMALLDAQMRQQGNLPMETPGFPSAPEPPPPPNPFSEMPAPPHSYAPVYVGGPGPDFSYPSEEERLAEQEAQARELAEHAAVWQRAQRRTRGPL